MHIWVAPGAVVEFFPQLHVEEIIEGLAMSESDWHCSGCGILDELLERIERFLKDKFPQPDADGG